MELVSWKSKDKNPIYSVKHWEKFRNTKGKNIGFIKEYGAKSKLVLAIKIAVTILRNYKKL